MLDRKNTNNTILEKFADFIIKSQELTEAMKKDALKIIYCFIYIQNEMNTIKKAVDDRDNPETYQTPRDKKHGVLRDLDGTSFHINSYKNGDEAVHSLQNLIDMLADSLKRLPPEQQLNFARKMEWDNDRGCLEARISPALEWATYALDVPLLDDVIAKAVRNNKNVIPDVFTILMQCVDQNIHSCAWDGTVYTMDADLIRRYLIDVYGEEEQKQEMPAASKQEEKHQVDDLKVSLSDATKQEEKKNNDDKLSELSTEALCTRALYSTFTMKAFSPDELEYTFSKKNAAEALSKRVSSTVTKTIEHHIDPRSTETTYKVKMLEPHIINIFYDGDKANYWSQFAYPFCFNKHHNRDFLNSKDFLSLLKEPTKILSQAVLFVNPWYPDHPVFFNAIKKLPDDDFITLIDKISPVTSNTLLSHMYGGNDKGMCGLAIVARYRSSSIWKALSKKISDETFCEILLKGRKGYSLFEVILIYQKSSVLEETLNRVSHRPSIFREIVSSKDNLALAARYKTSSDFIAFLVTFQKKDLVHDLIQGLHQHNGFKEAIRSQPPESVRTILHLFKEKKQSIFLSHFTAICLYQPADVILFSLEFLTEKQFDKINVRRDDYCFRTALNALRIKCSLDEKKKDEDVPPRLQILFATIRRIKLPPRGPMKSHLLEDEKIAIQSFKEGKIIVKIVKNKNFNNFQEGLKNYNFREEKRKKRERTGYKYIHLDAKKIHSIDLDSESKKESEKDYAIYHPPHPFSHIVKIRSPEEEKAHKKSKKALTNGEYTSTQKTSVTWVPESLAAVLFGNHDPEKGSVGFAFTLDGNIVKMMLREDRGTHAHGWIDNDINSVKAFSQRMQYCSFEQLELFKERVQQSPGVVNELLVKLRRDTLVSIVIGQDTVKNRKKAYERYQAVLKKMKLDLPIVFYDSERASVQVPNMILIDLEHQIVSQIDRYSFFLPQKIVLKPSRFSDFDGSIPLEKAYKVLNLLTEKILKNNADIDEILFRIGTIITPSPPAQTSARRSYTR